MIFLRASRARREPKGNTMTTHRIISGETPTEGLRVLDYDYNWGTITKVADSTECGPYCTAWHTVTTDAGNQKEFNCSRLTTRKPR